MSAVSSSSSFSSTQTRRLANVSQGLAGASFVLSLIVVASVLAIGVLRKGDRYRTVAVMCLCSAIYESTYLVGKHRQTRPECDVLGFVDQFGSIGVVVWNFVMSTELYVTVLRSRKTKGAIMTFMSDHASVVKHVCSWTIIAVASFLPLLLNAYGPVGSYCWITSDRDNHDAYRFGFFYAPLWIVILWELYVYTRIGRVFRDLRLRGLISGFHAEQAHKIVRAVGMYPLILILTWLFGTINRIQNSIDPDAPIFWLTMAQVISMHLQGASFAAVFFVLDTRARDELYKRIRRVLGYDRPRASQTFFDVHDDSDNDDDGDVIVDHALRSTNDAVVDLESTGLQDSSAPFVALSD